MPKWLQYYIEGGGDTRDPQKWLRNMYTTPDAPDSRGQLNITCSPHIIDIFRSRDKFTILRSGSPLYLIWKIEITNKQLGIMQLQVQVAIAEIKVCRYNINVEMEYKRYKRLAQKCEFEIQ